MATVCRQKIRGKEARVLPQSHTIEAVEVHSDRDLPYACDSFVGMRESVPLDIFQIIVGTEVTMGPPVCANPVQQGWGFGFLCCCPGVVPLRTHRIANERFAKQGISLLTAAFPELC